jgi:hypothetical protein
MLEEACPHPDEVWEASEVPHELTEATMPVTQVLLVRQQLPVGLFMCRQHSTTCTVLSSHSLCGKHLCILQASSASIPWSARTQLLHWCQNVNKCLAVENTAFLMPLRACVTPRMLKHTLPLCAGVHPLT